MSVLTELGDHLENLGIAAQSGAGHNLFLGSMPDSPDEIIVLYTYPGGKPEYVQDSAGPIAERPQIQAVTRAKTYEAAEALAWRVWSAFSVLTNVTLGATRYRSVRPNGSPALLKRDTDDRVLIFFNSSVDKEVNLVFAS